MYIVGEKGRVTKYGLYVRALTISGYDPYWQPERPINHYDLRSFYIVWREYNHVL